MRPSGTPSWASRMAAPRPASIKSFWSPASTSVLVPNRSGLGIGVPVPSKVTTKSRIASLMHFDPRFLHHLRPVGELGIDKFAIGLRRSARGLGSELPKRLAHAWLDQCAIDRRIQPPDGIVRRAVPDRKAAPPFHHETRKALIDDRRGVRQDREAFG